MTNGTKLSPETLKALRNKKKVIIVGGDAVVSKEIERQLQQSGVHIQRIFGQNRYDTSLAIANFFNKSRENLVFATGANFADVLTGTDLAVSINSPILLVRGNELTNSQLSYVSGQKTKKAYVLGGETAVSSTMFKYIQRNLKR